MVNLKKEYYGNEYGKNICVTETKLTITSLWDKHTMPNKGNDPYAGIVKILNPPPPNAHTQGNTRSRKKWERMKCGRDICYGLGSQYSSVAPRMENWKKKRGEIVINTC